MKEAEARAEEAPAEAWASDTDDTMAKQADHRAEKSAPSLDESVRKADRLFATANWSAAAEAYRDLLRRFPSHKDAPRWRERINQSLLAEEHLRRANEAKAAKARAADAAKGARE